MVFGHGGAQADRLRAELEELTGKPVNLNIAQYSGPPTTFVAAVPPIASVEVATSASVACPSREGPSSRTSDTPCTRRAADRTRANAASSAAVSRRGAEVATMTAVEDGLLPSNGAASRPAFALRGKIDPGRGCR